MAKLIKKIAATGAAIMMAMSISTMGASATDKHKTRSNCFNKDWEYSVTYKVGKKEVGMMVYGFETDWINEDYSWTKGYECDTKAGVQRSIDGKKINWSGYASCDKWSKEEVTHKGYKTVYYIRLRPTYSNLIVTSPLKSSYK